MFPIFMYYPQKDEIEHFITNRSRVIQKKLMNTIVNSIKHG
jgi:hypothetical protein